MSRRKTNGFALQQLFHFLKEEWDTDDELIPFKFPIKPIREFGKEYGEFKSFKVT